MHRYYFDLRSQEFFVPDDEGMDLKDIQAAQDEAARSLADMARDAVSRSDGSAAEMAVEVRDDAGPVMYVRFTCEIDRKN